MRYLYLLISFILLGCHEQALKKKQVHNYINSNVFSFNASVIDSTGHTVYADTIKLITYGKIWNLDPEQFEIGWKYPTDLRTFSTGVVIRGDSVWMHPPRTGPFKILEGNAFPCIKYPYQLEDQWYGTIKAPIRGWFLGYPSLIKGIEEKHITINSTYRFSGSGNIETNLGQTPYKIITAQSHSELGLSSATFHYSRSYGFIKMNFITLIKSQITLELSAINNFPITVKNDFNTQF